MRRRTAAFNADLYAFVDYGNTFRITGSQTNVILTSKLTTSLTAGWMPSNRMSANQQQQHEQN